MRDLNGKQLLETMEDAEREARRCRLKLELVADSGLAGLLRKRMMRAQILECLCRRALLGDGSAMDTVVEELERGAA